MSVKMWTLPPFGLVLAAMGLVWSKYDSLPERIAVHWGLHGADKWADKSPMTVLLPGLIGLAVLAVMAAKAWRLEGSALWRKAVLAWVVGILISVVVLLPLFGESGSGGL